MSATSFLLAYLNERLARVAVSGRPGGFALVETGSTDAEGCLTVRLALVDGQADTLAVFSMVSTDDGVDWVDGDGQRIAGWFWLGEGESGDEMRRVADWLLGVIVDG